MRPKPVPTTSASGYDLRPLSTAAARPARRRRSRPKSAACILHQGTEAPFCGTLLNNKQDGIYACRLCGLPLFKADAKFESGTGWPSFYSAVRPGPHRGDRRRQPRHDPHRDPLPALRQPPRPRVRRRPAADAQALLPELGVDGVLSRAGTGAGAEGVRLKPDLQRECDLHRGQTSPLWPRCWLEVMRSSTPIITAETTNVRWMITYHISTLSPLSPPSSK